MFSTDNVDSWVWTRCETHLPKRFNVKGKMGQGGKKFRLAGQIEGIYENKEVNLITVTIKLHFVCDNVELCVISDFRS
jgi:hypothetical protein